MLPDADLKIFLTASPEARAARRSGELKGADLAATREALIKRDAADSGRKTSPLAKADDAVEVDTTELTLDQVIECVVTLVEEKRAADDRRGAGRPARLRARRRRGRPAHRHRPDVRAVEAAGAGRLAGARRPAR